MQSAAANRKRILIAEDDEGISRLLVQMLEPDYEIHLARDGHEALRLAQRWPPDLLLLDIMMPGLDGRLASRLIRRLPSLAKVPIIFVTAKDAPEDAVEGLNQGARHYVTKPFKVFDLFAKIRETLDAS